MPWQRNNYYGKSQLAVWAMIIEMHIGEQKTGEQIAKELGISTATVGLILTKYYHKIPDNPVTIVLQSKINGPEKPEE
jgi:hypothetical protein